jgi:hypothetical protein
LEGLGGLIESGASRPHFSAPVDYPTLSFRCLRCVKHGRKRVELLLRIQKRRFRVFSLPEIAKADLRAVDDNCCAPSAAEISG